MSAPDAAFVAEFDAVAVAFVAATADVVPFPGVAGVCSAIGAVLFPKLYGSTPNGIFGIFVFFLRVFTAASACVFAATAGPFPFAAASACVFAAAPDVDAASAGFPAAEFAPEFAATTGTAVVPCAAAEFAPDDAATAVVDGTA